MSQTPPQIIDLIERFERHIESYRRPAYNETQARQEFINPFFEALGWDVANRSWETDAESPDRTSISASGRCFGDSSSKQNDCV